MRHRSKKKILGRDPHSRKALLRDLATALVTYEKIETSFGRAKVVKPMVERLITKAKKNDLATRRALMKVFTTEQPVKKLLEVIGPRYAERHGGYTRITKLGTRVGDRAETAILELV